MIKVLPLKAEDREQFIKDNQVAFKFGALEEFGVRDENFEEGEEIISRKAIEDAINTGIALRITEAGKNIGGAVVKVEGEQLHGIQPEIPLIY